MLRLFKARNPICITGALRHTYHWVVTATSEDRVIPNPKFEGEPGSGVAIYCVHGTADRNSSFHRLAKKLLPHLPPSVSSIHLLSFTIPWKNAGIEFFTAELLKKILANNHKKVILMGHSRGGRIVISFAEELAQQNGIEVVGIFPICAPIQGKMRLPGLDSWFLSLEQMNRNSVHTETTKQLILDSTNKYFFYSGQRDWMVPSKDAIIGNHPFLIIPKHDHLSIMGAKDLANSIIVNIREILSPAVEVNEESELAGDAGFVMI